MPYAHGAVQGSVRGIAQHILVLQMCWTAVCVEIGGLKKLLHNTHMLIVENTRKVFQSGVGGMRDPVL